MMSNLDKKIGRPKGTPASNKGSKMTDEQKQRVREGTKKAMQRPEVKAKMGIHFKKVKEEGTFAGMNNPAWVGGLGWWKQQVLIRDHFTCQKCGLYDPEIMVVDHVKPVAVFPELEKDMSNMQTLCPNDHSRKTKKDFIIYRFRRKGTNSLK